jgi:hypothetical protein
MYDQLNQVNLQNGHFNEAALISQKLKDLLIFSLRTRKPNEFKLLLQLAAQHVDNVNPGEQL